MEAALDSSMGIARKQKPTSAFEGLHILVVEDAPENRMLFSQALREVGALVNEQSDGVEAVREAERCHYDLILMDIEMPRMDGFEAARLIRRLGFIGPVIAITAQRKRDVSPRWREVGFSGFINKPIGPAALVHRLKRELRRAAHDDDQSGMNVDHNRASALLH